MPYRVIGNNTSFTVQTYNQPSQVTTADWNTLVADTLINMESVASRLPLMCRGEITGELQSSYTSTPYGISIKSRHFSAVVNWLTLPTIPINNVETCPITPKNVITGVSQLNNTSNYWVWRIPGIYHIHIEVEYVVSIAPAMIRLAILPYVNDGVNYHLSAPCDNTYTTINGTMPVFLLAYTSKANQGLTTGTHRVSLSGHVLVTSQNANNFPAIPNIAQNSINPLTAGNGYHLEIQGKYTNQGFPTSPRFSVTSGIVNMTLLQEWWQ